MRVITLQHVDGQAVTVVVDHIAAVMVGTTVVVNANRPCNAPCTFVYFPSGHGIPVIEPREDIITAMILAPHQ